MKYIVYLFPLAIGTISIAQGEKKISKKGSCIKGPSPFVQNQVLNNQKNDILVTEGLSALMFGRIQMDNIQLNEKNALEW